MGELAVALDNLAADADKWAEVADGVAAVSSSVGGLTLPPLVFLGTNLAASQAYEEVRAHTEQLTSDGAAELNDTVSTLRQIHADYIDSEEAAAAKYHTIWTFDG